ncbi:MAG: DUF4270 domain-containing protein [Rudanella sp.]|nr:DUF4270 domain-containing protein [Rudanella sp.]
MAKAAMLVGATLTILACQEPSEIGLAPTTPVGVFLSDTFTIRRSTILLDSVRSDGLSGLLVGSYSDPTFGKGKATSFVRFALNTAFMVADNSGNVIAANKIVYDSTKLLMGYDSYFFGDTLVRQEWGIHRLTEDLGTGHYDIRNTAAYEAQPVARFTVNPRPFSINGDSTRLLFKLPDAIGQDLIKLANTDESKDQTKFLALNKKGFAIVSTTSDKAALLQVVTGSNVAVYYHVEGETRVRTQLFTFTGPRLTNLTVNRAGTPLANLKAGQALPASATSDRSYIQAFCGVTTKIEFPSLLSLEKNRRVAINRADLVITPTLPDGAVLSSFGIVPYLTLAEANGFRLARTTPNGLVQLLPSFPGSAVNRSESSFFSPQVAVYNSRAKNYTFNMTGYIQSMMAGTTPNNGLIVLTPGDPSIAPVNTSTGVLSPTQQQVYLNDRVQRMILDGNASVKLVLFFTSSN